MRKMWVVMPDKTGEMMLGSRLFSISLKLPGFSICNFFLFHQDEINMAEISFDHIRV